MDSLDCDLIDGLAKLHPNWQNCSGSRWGKGKWLKALRRLSQSSISPKDYDWSCEFTDVRAPLDDEHVHNIELVQDIVKRDMGAIVTPRMLADLVLHKQGLFQYSKR